MFRAAFCSLLQTPAITAVVISPRLGIGSDVAIFSLFHQTVLRPLPVSEPQEPFLGTAPAEFKGGRMSTNRSGEASHVFSYPVFRILEEGSQGVADLAAFRLERANIATGTNTKSGSLLLVSGRYFSTLRLRPQLGRLLLREDDAGGSGNQVAVLGCGFWRGRLGSDSTVLDREVKVNGSLLRQRWEELRQ
jgi:putative ABC transport system permease protein